MTTEPSGEQANTDETKPESESQNSPAGASNLPEQTGESPEASQSSEAAKPKIQIGSQRDAADPALKPAKPKAVQEAISNPVKLDDQPDTVPDQIPEPVIQSTEGLGDDLEAEIEAAIGGVSMDSVLSGIQESDPDLEPNSRVKATISKVSGENVFVSIKGRFEGILPAAQFKSPPGEGQLVEVVVKNRNEDDGLYEVAIPGSTVAIGDWDDLNEGDVVEARVSGSNTGGLEAMVNNIRAFIPASQIDRFRVENFGDYVNQKLECVVTEVNPGKRRLVLSRRAVLDRENDEKKKQLLETLTTGSTCDGTVTKLMDFGAFVDLGGVEGLVHISKLSWDRVTHPKEVLKQGEKVKVKIESINKETGKISLSHRDTMEHPWEGIDKKYIPNETVKGKVSRITDFGAFVRLEPGVEGLVHISEVAHHRVVKVSNYVKQGDEVDVKILTVDSENQKIGLSIKATQAAPPKEEKAKVEEAEEPIRESAVPKRHQTLKGGTDRKTGGEGIGLNW